MGQSGRAIAAASFASAVLVAAVYVVATLPPRPAALAPAPANVVQGEIHVHSSLSDGSGSLDHIAEAAAKAGLGFVISTDHGDATRVPQPPAYLRGVLCVDAVEVSVAGGHIVALGLRGAAPYPLAGDAVGVVEDIHRLGGFAILAHPDSPKAELAWRGDPATTFDGVEWLNADAEWRTLSPLTMGSIYLRSWIRPEAAAQIFSRPAASLARWDAASRQSPTIGLAVTDAHGRPDYTTLFRSIAQAVVLDAPLNPAAGQAAADAERVLRAIRSGHTFSIVRGYGGPASLEFTAVAGTRVTRMGESAPLGVSLRFLASVSQAPGASVRLLRNGSMVASGRGTAIYTSRGEPGVFRVEVYFPGRPAPWLVSSPIVVPPPPAAADVPEVTPTRAVPVMDVARWTVEHDRGSTGAIVDDAGAMRFSFELAGGARASQFAAAAMQPGVSEACERVHLTLRADRPMRIAIQIKATEGKTLVRRRHSIYIDTEPRTFDLPIESFELADELPTAGSSQPIALPLQTLLVVVDTINATPSTRGTIWISDAGLRVR